jgi:hypothetical protein
VFDAQVTQLGLQGEGALCRAIVGVQDHHPFSHRVAPLGALDQLWA